MMKIERVRVQHPPCLLSSSHCTVPPLLRVLMLTMRNAPPPLQV